MYKVLSLAPYSLEPISLTDKFWAISDYRSVCLCLLSRLNIVLAFIKESNRLDHLRRVHWQIWSNLWRGKLSCVRKILSRTFEHGIQQVDMVLWQHRQTSISIRISVTPRMCLRLITLRVSIRLDRCQTGPFYQTRVCSLNIFHFLFISLLRNALSNTSLLFNFPLPAFFFSLFNKFNERFLLQTLFN